MHIKKTTVLELFFFSGSIVVQCFVHILVVSCHYFYFHQNYFVTRFEVFDTVVFSLRGSWKLK